MAIHDIQFDQYHRVEPLLRGLAMEHPMCSAVLNGTWPGQVWANSVEGPTSALMVTFLAGGGAAWCYLTGDPRDNVFTAAVNDALFKKRAAGDDVSTFLVTCDPEDWGGRQADVGRPREPVVMKRRHYTCRAVSYDWRSALPEAYDVHPLTIDLLEQDELEVPPAVRDTLVGWRSVGGDSIDDFGVVACDERGVVAWATIDFVGSGAGDLGFQTVPEHRLLGLGTAVAGAVLGKASRLGLTVHWTCAEDNVGSQRTAEKLGLVRGDDYVMYLYLLDEHSHSAHVAYSLLSSGDPEGALARFEELFESRADVSPWALHDAAQACGALGRNDKALHYLRMAAERGWSAADVTTTAAEFTELHGETEWHAIVEHMRRNATA